MYVHNQFVPLVKIDSELEHCISLDVSNSDTSWSKLKNGKPPRPESLLNAFRELQNEFDISDDVDSDVGVLSSTLPSQIEETENRTPPSETRKHDPDCVVRVSDVR